MTDRLMYIPNAMMIYRINPSVEYNDWLKSLDTQINESTNQNSLKVPKVVNPTNTKKMSLKNFGD